MRRYRLVVQDMVVHEGEGVVVAPSLQEAIDSDEARDIAVDGCIVDCTYKCLEHEDLGPACPECEGPTESEDTPCLECSKPRMTDEQVTTAKKNLDRVMDFLDDEDDSLSRDEASNLLGIVVAILKDGYTQGKCEE